jgi:hypothetical protein
MDSLVEKLASKEQKVATNRCKDSLELQQHFKRGFILLMFSGTQGGTELGCRLEMESCSSDSVDFEKGSGMLKLVGSLTLNFQPIKIVALIDVARLAGTAEVIPITDD